MNESLKNTLDQEKSPYLLQHKDNPIAWQTWGPKAFELARDLDRPIFLSIGYSTCHWCHVMAHESFEDQEVADVLNANFVCIKVDREERPDVDDVYMTALQTITGGGGWPMSMWLTSEGKPFFAGTYFPKFRLLQLLRRIEEVWKNQRGALLEDGEKLMNAVRANEESDLEIEDSADADYDDLLKTYISHFQHHFDQTHGGFGKSPKFPQTMNLMLMMRQDFKSGLQQAEAMVNTTLLNMLRGGVYDQLQGGFHRYSVDEKWLVPHFEKMLYDQALLAVTLIEASQLYGEPELLRGARETLDYVMREMTSKEGGFYSAQDADSLDPKTGQSEEGHFATYEYGELQAALSAEEMSILTSAYGVSPGGNFEGRNILHLQEGFDGAVKERPEIVSAFKKLRGIRANRPAPHLDDKVIAGWNGWMIWAFAKGASAFQEPKYLATARKALDFVKAKLWDGQKLRRFYRDGAAVGNGTAEDYASMIHACLEVYQVSFDPELSKWALELQKEFDKYWDGENGLYYSNDGTDPLLPMRPRDDYDGVTPSSNSMACYNLWRLYLLTGEAIFKDRSQRIAQALFPKFKRYPSGLAYLGLALDLMGAESAVAVVSQNAGWPEDLHSESIQKFRPHTFWAKAETGWPVTVGKAAGKPELFVCFEGKCLAPAKSRDEALKQL